MTIEPGLTTIGALRDIKVLEFGHYVAAPLAAMLLGDQGALVTKVERPGGDPARAVPAFAIWNRGKESLEIDLKTTRGRAEALELVRDADVVLENFRPGKLEQLGLGPDLIDRVNPRLVYCSFPGFPPESRFRDERGWEAVVGALTGTYQRGPQSTAMGVQDSPLFSPLHLPSTFAAFAGAAAVVGGLIERGRSGVGQRIEVPLYSATFAAIGMFLVRMRDSGQGWTAWEKLPLPAPYRCRDGRWIQVYGNNRRHLEALFAALEHSEWTDDAVSVVEIAPSSEVVSLWRQRFTDVFATRDSWDWEDRISEAGGVCVVCRTTEEFFDLDHAYDAGLLVKVDDQDRGPMLQPGLAVNLRRTPGRVGQSAPALGGGRPSGERPPSPAIAALDTSARPSDVSLPLAGIRVLDLSILLAGPSCGRTLAEYGADVIKIDDPNRTIRSDSKRTRLMWIDVNRGKRSVLLDLKTEEGREAFLRLVDTADVIVENFRAGKWSPVARESVGPTKLEKLGLGYEDLRKRKPNIIYLSISAYGRFGRFTERGGYEQAGQALTGIMARHGGRSSVPLALAYPFNDYGTGLVAVYGVLLALLERAQSGQGQALDTSLAMTAAYLQSIYNWQLDGRDRTELEGPNLHGSRWSSRFYKAEDGWFLLYAPPDEENACLENLARELGAELSSASTEARDSELSNALQDLVASRSRNQSISLLRTAGFMAVEHVTTSELVTSDDAIQAHLVEGRPHPAFGYVDHGAPIARFSRTQPALGCPAPADGADTDEVLSEIGYTSDAIDALRRAGVAG